MHSLNPKTRTRIINVLLKRPDNKHTAEQLKAFPCAKLLRLISGKKALRNKNPTKAEAYRERTTFLDNRVEKRRIKRELDANRTETLPPPKLVKAKRSIEQVDSGAKT